MAQVESGLSTEQAAAAHHPLAGPHLLIVARPGSGKTFTLAARARYLLRQGVDPRQILAMTFSQRAAVELKDRLPGDDIWAGTFHAVCADILEWYGSVVGVHWPFRIADETKARELAIRAIAGLGYALPEQSGPKARFLREVKDRIERRKRLGQEEHHAGPDDLIPLDHMERIDARYGELLREANALDYGDLIARVVIAIEGDEATAQGLRNRIGYLLVDEFHDISPEQYRLLSLLAPAGGHTQVLIVGDPDQAIYGWRDADVMGMLRHYRADYRPAEYHLTTNYRSPEPIVAAADALMGDGRITRSSRAVRQSRSRPVWCGFPGELAEARGIATLIQRAMASGRYTDYGSFAVLYRGHVVGNAIEAELLRADIPVWRVQSERFFDDPDAQESLRYLELVAGLHGEGFEPALNWPRVIVDEVTMAHLRRLARGRGLRLGELLRHAGALRDEISPLTRGVLDEFMTTIGRALAPLVELPMGQMLGPFLAALAARRSPISRAERAALRDTLDLVAPTLRTACSALAAAIAAGRQIRVEPRDCTDCAAAAMVIRYTLDRYFQIEVEIWPHDGEAATPFTIVLGVEQAADANGCGIGPQPMRTVDLTVTTRAWRLMQLLLMAHESGDMGHYLLFDVETTSLDLQRARILEFAALPFVQGEAMPGQAVAGLLRPPHPEAIAREATDIHGLRWADVADAPEPRAALPALLSWLDGHVVVGHNIDDFDLTVVRRMAAELGLTLPAFDTIDTRRMAERLWPDERSYRLGDLARRVDPATVQQHRAVPDCQLTAGVFAELLTTSRREREIDVLSECLPLVAASLVVSGVDVVNDNAILMHIAARAHEYGQGAELLARWAREVAPGVADAVDEVLSAAYRQEPEEDERWQRLTRGWEATVNAFCQGERDQSVIRFLHFAALAQSIDTISHAGAAADGDVRYPGRRERVALMTIHSAKGLEWRVVFLAGVEDGLFPHFRATSHEEIDEERRALYVGMTRAQERLFLFSAASRNGFDHARSPFLEPLLGSCVDERVPGDATAAS